VLLDQVGPDAVGSVSFFPPIATARTAHGKTGLSSGTKTGIAVAVAVVVIVFSLTFGAFCVWSRKKGRSLDHSEDNIPELEGSIKEKQTATHMHRYEADGIEKKELDGTEVIHELDMNDKAEMPTNKNIGMEVEDTGKYLHEMDGETVEERRIREKQKREKEWNGVG